MTLCLYRSNRVERLAEALASVVRTPVADAFARETVVVQGPGMERWLSMRLSEHLGVWANPWFPFPRALLELLMDTVLGPNPDGAERYRRDALTFSIAGLLPQRIAHPAFEPVRAYLTRDERGDRLLSLSDKLAGLFDQYMVYRPDFVLAWEAGEGTHFQAELWRSLSRELGPGHPARRFLELERALTGGVRLRAAHSAFPERVSLFGISTLPPQFLRLLGLLSEQLDVHYFLLVPTPEFFGDLDRSMATGNDATALLASLGRLSRELCDALTDMHYTEPLGELFEAPGEDSILRGLQSDLMHLCARSRQKGPALLPPLGVRDTDDSLSVHVCHNAVRELEVLRDQLRARFEACPTLEPRDVVVFAPDIERYVAAIESVFSSSEAAELAPIPYQIADRRASVLSEVADALLAVLDLVRSRLHLSEVLDLLHRPVVRERFDIGEPDMALVERWLIDAGARWGIDDAHRAREGQPRVHQNSLRFGLERLLVGYACADGAELPFAGVLAASEVEGQRALLLGKVARFLECLFRLADALREPLPVARAVPVLLDALAQLFSTERGRERDHHALRESLSQLAADAARAGHEAPLSSLALRRLLEKRVDAGRISTGFLSGGVTFCEHVPMRAIPFRVVCLIGMDDESFPRRTARPSFDLMADKPRRLDRNLRDDDRQLFLEAILSARDALIVTYVGRSETDDSERPASALLDQLLRVVERHFVAHGKGASLSLGPEGSVAERVRHVHALARFDLRYFRNPKDPVFFSHDERALSTARTKQQPNREVLPFVRTGLDVPKLSRAIDVEELVRFFRSPARQFARTTLGISLPEDLDPLPEREPLVLDGLSRWQIGNDLITQEDLSAERRTRLALEGRLPAGTLGDACFDEIAKVAGRVRELSATEARSSDVLLDLAIGGLTLRGRIRPMYGATHEEITYSTLQAKHMLAAWIRHLCLCTARPDASPITRLIGRNAGRAQAFRFAFQADARAHLEELCALFELGQRTPLPFLVDAAYDYVDGLRSSKGQDALEKARRASQPQAPRDGDDDYVRQVFGADVLQRLAELHAPGEPSLSFTSLARRIFEPLCEHLEQESP